MRFRFQAVALVLAYATNTQLLPVSLRVCVGYVMLWARFCRSALRRKPSKMAAAMQRSVFHKQKLWLKFRSSPPPTPTLPTTGGVRRALCGAAR